MNSEFAEVILVTAAAGIARRAPRRVLRGVVVGLAVSIAIAAPATGAFGTPAAAASVPGPGFLDTGFADAPTFQGAPISVAAAWLARARGIGSSYVRLIATWKSIAPATPASGFRAANADDPGYSWSALDSQIEDSVAHGQHVVLTLFSAPAWALGRNPPKSAPAGTWRPSPRALGEFAHAIAERYSGRFVDPRHPSRNLPRVRFFQAWNEPNVPYNLSPQWTRNRRGRWLPASPAFYRRMLNAVYSNVKAVQADAYVLAAGTEPYGDPPGVGRMAPVVFVRELLCLRGPGLRPEYCPDPAHFDALDHHPYSLTPTIHAFSPDGISVPDLGKLTAILRVAGRTGRALPAGAKSIWVTEIVWGSNPPDKHAIPAARQARYLARAFYELWRQGVSHIFWLLIRGFPYGSLTGDGVYFQHGTPKPSAAAFRFPFVAVPGPLDRRLTLWGHTPHPGVVVIERGQGHGWIPLMRLTTTAGGIFYAQRRLGSHLVLRARIGTVASLGWSTH